MINRYLALLFLSVALLPSILHAQWDPTTVGSGTNVIFEFNSAHAGSWDSDGSGTDVGDGGGIYTMLDQSGNANHAIQTTAGARLVYDIDGFAGAHPCAQGASGDSMTIANRAILRNSSGWTLFWLVDYVDSGTFQGVFGAFTPSFSIRYSHTIDSSDQPYANLRNPDATSNYWTSNDPLTNGTEYVIAWRQNLPGSEGTLWIDGTKVHTVSLTGTSNTTDSDAGADPVLFDDALNEGKYNRSCTAAIILIEEVLSDSDMGTASTGLQNNFAAAPTARAPLRMMRGFGS